MNNSVINNKLISCALDITATWIKDYIHTRAHRQRKEVTLTERIESLKSRIIKLEKKAATNSTETDKNVTDKLEWESIEAAVERAKSNPEVKWVLPGIIKEGSICNLQAVEKVGKSILVTQIAHDCAYGLISKIIENCNEQVNKQEVFLYDAELDDDDMIERNINLHDNRIRRCRNAEFDSVEALFNHVELSVKGIESNALIIADNISAICPKFTENDVKYARSRIKYLQENFLKSGYRLTIILVHHTKSGVLGVDVHDSAGSRYWTRLSKLNLAFSETRFGSNIKLLSIASGRNKIKNLKADEGICLRLTDQPYPHFVNNGTVKINEAIPVKHNSRCTKTESTFNQVAQASSVIWKLQPDEVDYVAQKYVPKEYGLGKLAIYLLNKRGLEDTKKSRNLMKNAVDRALKRKGLK